jgi:hypothetical protein
MLILIQVRTYIIIGKLFIFKEEIIYTYLFTSMKKWKTQLGKPPHISGFPWRMKYETWSFAIKIQYSNLIKLKAGLNCNRFLPPIKHISYTNTSLLTKFRMIIFVILRFEENHEHSVWLKCWLTESYCRWHIKLAFFFKDQKNVSLPKEGNGVRLWE